MERAAAVSCDLPSLNVSPRAPAHSLFVATVTGLVGPAIVRVRLALERSSVTV
jgi:hypothetical protein